ncbi:MAG TPA: SDR family NAD(P)-dependent oxidoreductase [Pirellulaceae bacterium]|nr:SDR family NAD(P)-dependent oxidoreductase [Pirellulaceae bacterium]HMO93823.1 SDR family NAD(P)-dependent oxidoreductase [Pirellulaceae bacterium]HMP70682.1 SDR family NAD(P)-dependent oxidoreductase [Pirellulaceae bacterium]
MNAKTVLITGVSSGIGRALVNDYLSRGDVVYGVSRRTPSDIEFPERFAFATLDLTEHERVRSVIDRLLTDVTKLDLVTLNAGQLTTIADMRQTTLATLQKQMDVNVWANKTLLDTLFEKWEVRQVVAISSGASINGNRGWNGYAISKAALNMAIKLYAHEMPSTHFAAVAPGLVETAMQAYLCGLPNDERYPLVSNLKARRGTSEMPAPAQISPKLISFFDWLLHHIPSGEFVDIRDVAWDSAETTALS